MEQKRKKDSRKQEDLQSSLKKKRDIHFEGIVVPPFLSSDVDEPTTDWQEIYNTIDGIGGTTEFDTEKMRLTCEYRSRSSIFIIFI